jgi:hypothetical protein
LLIYKTNNSFAAKNSHRVPQNMKASIVLGLFLLAFLTSVHSQTPTPTPTQNTNIPTNATATTTSTPTTTTTTAPPTTAIATKIATPTPTPTPAGDKFVTEISISYELCEWDETVPPVESRQNWNNVSLNVGALPALVDGQESASTIYGAVQLWDSPVTPQVPLLYVRLVFDDLSQDSVTVRMRQVHTSSAVQTKSQFFAMSRAERQKFYQSWLPGDEPHDTDITYPEKKQVTTCAGGWECGYVLSSPQLSDFSDVMPVYIFSIQNSQQNKVLTGTTKVKAYAGDKTPDCRIAPVGIVLGSIVS